MKERCFHEDLATVDNIDAQCRSCGETVGWQDVHAIGVSRYRSLMSSLRVWLLVWVACVVTIDVSIAVMAYKFGELEAAVGR